MYFDMSDAVLVGNVSFDKNGNPPELRYIPEKAGSSTMIPTTTVRVIRNMGNREPQGFWVEVFGDIAINLVRSLQQGDRLVCVGNWNLNQWTDRENGQRRERMVLKAREVGFSCRWNAVKSLRNSQQQTTTSAPAPQQVDEDVPFAL